MNHETKKIREPAVLILLAVVTLILYAKYYNGLIFESHSTIPPAPPPEGSYFRIHVPGFEGALFKFVAIHAAPFVFAAFYFKSWNLRRAFALSISIWILVYLYSAIFRANEFRAIYVDSYQCFVTAISTYPLMAVCVAIGNFVGKLGRAFKQSIRSE